MSFLKGQQVAQQALTYAHIGQFTTRLCPNAFRAQFGSGHCNVSWTFTCKCTGRIHVRHIAQSFLCRYQLNADVLRRLNEMVEEFQQAFVRDKQQY